MFQDFGPRGHAMLRFLSYFRLGPFIVYSNGGNVGRHHTPLDNLHFRAVIYVGIRAQECMKVRGQFVGVSYSAVAFARIKLHVVRLGGKCLYPLSHFT